MNIRQIVLLLFVVLPGLGVSALCAYYLLPKWAALDASYKNYRQVIESPSSSVKDVLVAKTAQEIHRINCFAEGVGCLFGEVILTLGIHGICILPEKIR